MQSLQNSPLPLPRAFERWTELFISFALLLTALLVLLQFEPFRQRLQDDPAITAYIAQMAAQAVPPHAGVYDVRTSLAPLIGALFLYVGKFFGLQNLIALRVGTMLVTALCAVVLYYVARGASDSRRVGILSALILLGFDFFGKYSIIGIELKTFMVLFGLLTLFFLMQQNWFWAGVCGACAGLSWQVGFGYAALALLSAFLQARNKPRAILAASVGIALPIAIYVAYFYTQGALRAMYEQSVLALAFGRGRAAFNPLKTISHIALVFRQAYAGEIPFAILALLGWIGGWIAMARARRIRFYFLENPRTSGVLLAAHGLVLVSLIDFQSYPDWFPLLPFMALAAALVLVCVARTIQQKIFPSSQKKWLEIGLVIVVAFAAFWNLQWSPHAFDFKMGGDLENQIRVAEELNRRYPTPTPLLVLGKAEFLFLMERKPFTRYVFLLRGTDAVIDAFEPGGFAGWLKAMRRARPEWIATYRLARNKFVQRKNYQGLMQWLGNEYVPLDACSAAKKGTFYVRADLAAQQFSNSNPNDCFRLTQ